MTTSAILHDQDKETDMKTSINFKSRTVWTGLIMMGFGIAGIFYPDLNMSAAPDVLLGTGIGLVFLKS